MQSKGLPPVAILSTVPMQSRGLPPPPPPPGLQLQEQSRGLPPPGLRLQEQSRDLPPPPGLPPPEQSELTNLPPQEQSELTNLQLQEQSELSNLQEQEQSELTTNQLPPQVLTANQLQRLEWARLKEVQQKQYAEKVLKDQHILCTDGFISQYWRVLRLPQAERVLVNNTSPFSRTDTQLWWLCPASEWTFETLKNVLQLSQHEKDRVAEQVASRIRKARRRAETVRLRDLPTESPSELSDKPLVEDWHSTISYTHSHNGEVWWKIGQCAPEPLPVHSNPLPQRPRRHKEPPSVEVESDTQAPVPASHPSDHDRSLVAFTRQQSLHRDAVIARNRQAELSALVAVADDLAIFMHLLNNEDVVVPCQIRQLDFTLLNSRQLKALSKFLVKGTCPSQEVLSALLSELATKKTRDNVSVLVHIPKGVDRRRRAKERKKTHAN